MESKATVKGLIFLGVKNWFVEKKLPEDFERFVQALPVHEQKYWIKSKILPTSRIPASVYINMYKVICAQLNEATFQKIAGTVAFNDLGTVFRLFIKLGTPTFTANAFPGAYKQYFNQGDLSSIKVAAKSAEFELLGAEAYGEAGCSGTLGWTRMALSYAGAKYLRAEQTTCRYRGGERCLFHYTWE